VVNAIPHSLFVLTLALFAKFQLGEQIQTETVTPGPLTSYLIWSLRANFPIVLLSQTLAFWAFCFVFAFLIYVGALVSPECLMIPDMNWEQGGSYFIDCFALSWTTFATVVSLRSYSIEHTPFVGYRTANETLSFG
jgi:hypothetical protein